VHFSECRNVSCPALDGIVNGISHLVTWRLFRRRALRWSDKFRARGAFARDAAFPLAVANF